MALPVSNGPKSRDVAVRNWAGLTVRIAWTLLARGVKVRADVLHDARVNALLQIDRNATQHHAEDLAAHTTRAFVRRARGLRPDDPWPQDAAMPLSPRWVRTLERSTDALGGAVFRKHYGDNRSMARLEQSLRVDRAGLEAARSGLREVVRGIGRADGLPFTDWPAERIDRLLVRLAAFAPGPCPPAVDIVEGAHREHVRHCPRCDRLARMVRSGILTLDDLMPPTLGARPQSHVSVLVLQLHPDARAQRASLATELGGSAHPLGDDLLLCDADELEAIGTILQVAAEVERPHRRFLRGAILEGPGAWCAHGLLGPLTDGLDRAVQTRSWGTIDRIGELPEPLPVPPSATSMWAGVGTMAVVALILMRLVWTATATPAAEAPLDVTFTDSRHGLWVSFDAPEPDAVAVVAWDEGLSVLTAGTDAASKAPLAVGDGSYRARTGGRGLLVVHRPGPIELDPNDLSELEGQAAPLQSLAAAITTRHPDATVRWHAR